MAPCFVDCTGGAPCTARGASHAYCTHRSGAHCSNHGALSYAHVVSCAPYRACGAPIASCCAPGSTLTCGDVWLLGIRCHNLLHTFSIFYHGLHMR